jgi:hypothetical protein
MTVLTVTELLVGLPSNMSYEEGDRVFRVLKVAIAAAQ